VSRRRYTEAQFRAAVDDPSTKTIADLCRALGLLPRGGNYETVLDFAEQHGIGVGHLRRLTVDAVDDAAFRRVIERADGYPAACRELGVRPHTGSHRRIDQRADRLGIRIPDHWSRPGTRSRWSSHGDTYPEAEVRRAVLGNFTFAATIRDLGDAPSRGATARLQRSIQRYDLNIDHFGGEGRRLGAKARELYATLVQGRRHRSCSLASRLVELGLKDRCCEMCGRRRWLGRQIPLELDHVNGDRTDNRFANLRLLCPNCHALTPTYRGRNIGADRANPGSACRTPLPECPPVTQLALL
jgi:hypothetical protein